MAQAILKNTFIAFVTEDVDTADPDYASPRWLVRSRSAETLRSRPLDEKNQELQEKTQQALRRLTAVFSGRRGPPALRRPRASGQEIEETVHSFDRRFNAPANSVDDILSRIQARRGPPAGAPSASGLGGGLAELETSQEEQHADATHGPIQKSSPRGPSGPAQKPWDKHRRVASSCSLSTMAPDEASEDGELSRAGSKRMPRVCSSGSMSSLVSSCLAAEKGIDEDAQVQFQLTGLDDEGEALARAGAPWPARGRSGSIASGIQEKEMRHCMVPKTQNMEDLYKKASTEEPPTTMMIRNIPGRYSQDDLMMDLKDLGLGGTYDFLYMPVDKGTAASVGYGFVNFVDASWAVKCMQLFSGYRFRRNRRSSHKVARVSVAHLQGLEQNLQHYESSAVNTCKEKRRRPVVVANIAHIVE